VLADNDAGLAPREAERLRAANGAAHS
jgi:hypothetical protein